MKLNEAKETQLLTAQETFTLSETALKTGKQTLKQLNNLNRNGQREAEQDGRGDRQENHASKLLSKKELKKWKKLSERRKKQIGQKAERRSGRKQPIFAEEDRKDWERKRKNEHSNRKVEGQTDRRTVSSTEIPGSLGKKKSSRQAVKKAAELSKNAASKGVGAATGGASYAVEKAKKTAQEFRKTLSREAEIKGEQFAEYGRKMKEENQEKSTVLEILKYGTGATAVVAAPVAAALMAFAASVAASIIGILIMVLVPILPIILILALILTLAGVMQTEGSQGYFGARWYWIEFETGYTDERAFGVVLGDNGAAFGIQFDYRYTLQEFLQYCVEADPVAYHAFIPYLNVPRESLRGNTNLAEAWTSVFESNQSDFIEKQKEFCNARYYIPAEERLINAGIRIEDRSEVCKGAVLSFVFQGCRMGIASAVTQAGITNDTSDEDFIKKLYEYRREHYSLYANRYIREEATALQLLQGGTGNFQHPCPAGVVTSGFGNRVAPTVGATSRHDGIDFGAATGTPIYASAGGTVKRVDYNSARGNYVVIDHGGGMETWYQHCSAVYVSRGDVVAGGQEIAAVGATGVVTGPHLHFEIHENGTPVNPENYLDL